MTDKITVEEYRAAYKKPPKFGNKITRYKNMTFDSRGECDRYQELELLEKIGEIQFLKRQEIHMLWVKQFIIGTYQSDFEYFEKGKLIIEDFKGVQTGLFKRSWKHLAAMYYDDIESGKIELRITKKQRGRR